MHPFLPAPVPAGAPIVDISKEIRDAALKRTADTLGELDKLRRALELPVEQLPIVIETYNANVHALNAEERRKEIAANTSRVPMIMQSQNADYTPRKILAGGKPTEVTVTPHGVFRAEDISIHGDRSRWRVHEIKVGNRSQNLGHYAVPIPGEQFGPGGMCEKLRFDTAQTAMNFTLFVEYIGPEVLGEVFEATVVGTCVAY